ncbi:hypothetical protein BT67DRAFT_441130 [Trichocladium antarcticum]|uniref:SUN domain-containing protein n=1 Tax=Trichocladium antarcticum TaxID=1450529 RepID=A0AAN6ZDW5_9PEZI|nr:hypothetical protein BT67DRAFT_441130 [Trichocladium antarcticum]
MRAPANWAKRIGPALALLGLHAAAAHGSRSASATAVSATPAATEVCESRTINYITHTLPQQCLRTAWTSPSPAATTTEEAISAAPTTTVSASPQETRENATAHETDVPEDLGASAFMSFEEWKEMMVRRAGQDPANIKGHKLREHRGERDPSPNNAEFDSFGEEGEISLDFDALAEKVSEMASPPSSSTAPQTDPAVAEEHILYDDGKTQYYRSKDAGKTCKERFSYSSFDAGATVLKTSAGAKNAKAILVENKDSYMLLECRSKSKFVIVELSDDILVDTVVLANFEFFSSMIRRFRVSASDRYPVKTDKWVDLGTFEARNAREIQPFLIEHPQIYTKYIRIEFLTHYGNEFYCPVSLLRVHGTRMLDTWKEPNHDDEPELVEGSVHEPVPETEQVQEPPAADNSSVDAQEEAVPEVITEIGISPWTHLFQNHLSLEVCELRSPTTADPTPVASGSGRPRRKPAGDADTVTSRSPADTGADEASQSTTASSSVPASPESHISRGKSTSVSPSTTPSVQPQAGNNSAASDPSQKQSDARANATDTPSPSPSPTVPRNKTTSVHSSPSASPTVQESFFKTITKRLQLLESNTSLSLQYIEEQSRFLQDVLLKMERKHVTRVDTFLDSLNKTVLSELRTVRTQYDQIWQSTVIALETQREQSQREIVALTSRLNVLADEVVFQKRMAIVQSVLLLACLVLVIFSRGGLAAFDNASFPTTTTTILPHSAASTTPRRWQGGAQSLADLSFPSPPPSTATTLAASALPRHLYSTSAALRDKTLPLTPSPSDYSRDSTPARQRHLTNDMANSPGPSPSSSSETSTAARVPRHDDDGDGDDDDDDDDDASAAAAQRGGAGDAALSSIETNHPRPHRLSPDIDADADADDETGPGPPAPTRDGGGGFGGSDDHGGREQGTEKQPPPKARPRAAASQLGGFRKPLPALPEDPS